MSSEGSERALYIQAPGGAVFALLHERADALPAWPVLMCPPFGWEDMCSYRIRREWAQELARAGHEVLRIDLPGSGDSAGTPHDPDQLERWTLAVDAAARWLAARADSPVAAVGIGLGGLLACRAALRGAPVEGLATWAAAARGRPLARELRAFASMAEAGVERPDGVPPASGEEGGFAANGYLITGATLAELEQLDLRDEPAASPTPLRRALLLGRDSIAPDAALAELLTERGVEVRQADGPGFGAMMVEPQDARTPREVIDAVGVWLQEPAPGVPAGAGVSVPAAEAPSHSTHSPFHSTHATIDTPHGRVHERPLELQGPGGGIFGVLAAPDGEALPLTALLLNAGPQRRTGPGRLWVDIGRRWAARGVPTARVDLAGIGDSDGDSSVLARIDEFYRPEYVEQTLLVLGKLDELGLPAHFATLGLCSGAYWGAQAALADERVGLVVMLNPRTLVFDRYRHAVRHTRHIGRRALQADTWRRVLRGEVKPARHLEAGRSLATRLRRRSGAVEAEAETGPGTVEELFDVLRDRGQRGLVLFTGEEVLRRELQAAGSLTRWGRWPNLTLELAGTGADTHTLAPLWLQQQVNGLVDAALQDELERIGAADG